MTCFFSDDDQGGIVDLFSHCMTGNATCSFQAIWRRVPGPRAPTTFKVAQDSNVTAHRIRLPLRPSSKLEIVPQSWAFRAASGYWFTG